MFWSQKFFLIFSLIQFLYSKLLSNVYAHKELEIHSFFFLEKKEFYVNFSLLDICTHFIGVTILLSLHGCWLTSSF